MRETRFKPTGPVAEAFLHVFLLGEHQFVLRRDRGLRDTVVPVQDRSFIQFPRLVFPHLPEGNTVFHIVDEWGGQQ